MWFEPTDVRTATRIFEAGPHWKDVLHFVSPNRNELKLIANCFDIPVPEDPDLAAVKNIAERLNEHIPVVITTLGSQGVLVSANISEIYPFFKSTNGLICKKFIDFPLYRVCHR